MFLLVPILHILLEKLEDPLRIILVTSLLPSSYFLYGNLGASNKVELWCFLYSRGKIHFGGSAMVAAISYSIAAYLTSSPSLRNHLLLTAFLSFTNLPFTVLAMRPLNNEIRAMHESGSLRDKTKLLSDDGKKLEMQAIEKIERWRKLHWIRIMFGAIVWIGGLAALIVCD